MTQTAAPQFTETETSRHSCAGAPAICPNGSVQNATDFYTTIVLRQDWADTEENGIYAGKSYRISHVWHSGSKPGQLDTLISSSSRPWTA